MRITESYADIEEMSMDELLTWYSDLYQSSSGVRPHFNPRDISREELISAIRELLGEKDPRIGESIRLLKKLVKEEVRRITAK